ncbi:unnamed protein product [Cylicocyclus nassatus]|uniref:Uncharacterized protein n=1 Tax=Cylicocyclus nassatus TaxID=53992 RepID=A0AA36DQL0_CYLNA|nr:unnamed protein product [Cylicocyclus nassatus]
MRSFKRRIDYAGITRIAGIAGIIWNSVADPDNTDNTANTANTANLWPTPNNVFCSSLCRVMSIQPFVVNIDFLANRCRGVEPLNALGLQQACRARGMRAIGLSEERLREQKVVLAEGEKERVAVEEIASTSTDIAKTSAEAIQAAKVLPSATSFDDKIPCDFGTLGVHPLEAEWANAFLGMFRDMKNSKNIEWNCLIEFRADSTADYVTRMRNAGEKNGDVELSGEEVYNKTAHTDTVELRLWFRSGQSQQPALVAWYALMDWGNILGKDVAIGNGSIHWQQRATPASAINGKANGP